MHEEETLEDKRIVPLNKGFEDLKLRLPSFTVREHSEFVLLIPKRIPDTTEDINSNDSRLVFFI